MVWRGHCSLHSQLVLVVLVVLVVLWLWLRL
jgi:hypothetical protein